MHGKNCIVAVIMVMSLVAFSIAAAEQQAGSLDKGKALFNDPTLGTTGKSCNDCHPNGKGVEKAAGKTDLERIVNTCITQGLKGRPLDVKSAEMQSLVTYIKSFGGKPKETKKPSVGC